MNKLKNIDTLEPNEDLFNKIKSEQIFKKIIEYENINLNDVNYLFNEIKNISEKDNKVDLDNGEYISFKVLSNFLYDIKSNIINDSNKEEKYNNKLKYIEKKFANTKKNSYNIRLYRRYLNDLKKILFTKRSSGKGLASSFLSFLLSKIYTNNSSKELINDIKQLVKNLYDNKQITKQVYNNLNKAITYKNDS